MQITFNSTMIRENENDQTVYFTLTDDQGNVYQWHCDAPKGIDVQAYLEKNADKFLTLIRRREFPVVVEGRDYIVQDNQSELAALEEWIKDGCMLRDAEGKYTGAAERKSWISTHPEKQRIIDGEKISEDTFATLEAAKSVDELKNVLKIILKGN